MYKRLGWIVLIGMLIATRVMAGETKPAFNQTLGLSPHARPISMTEYFITPTNSQTIGLGPRPVAMGEAFIAQADDLNSVAWNPAGLSDLSQILGHQVGYMHTLNWQATSLDYFVYVQHLFPDAGLGGYASYLQYTNTEAGLPWTEGSLFTGALGYGQALNNHWAIGASCKIISQTMDTSHDYVFAADLSGLFKTGETGLRLGAVLQNLGGTGPEIALPLNLKVGGSYTLNTFGNDTWTILTDITMPLGETSLIAINLGTEYWFHFWNYHFFAVRAGYPIKKINSSETLAGLSAGLGLQLAWFGLDYAVVSFGDQGLLHQLAGSFNF